MEQKKVNYKDILLLLGALLAAVVIYLGVQIAGMIVAGIYYVIVSKGDIKQIAGFFLQQNVLMGITAAMHICFLLVFGIWYKMAFAKNKKAPVKRLFTLRNSICFIIMGISLQFCISYAMQVVTPLIPEIMENYEKLISMINLGTSVLSIVVTVFIAPFGEEFIFRGVVLGYAKRVMPFWVANLLQALAFGIYHANLVQGMYAFCLGLLFGYLVKKCDTIMASMAVHFCVNGMANVLSLLPGGEEQASVEPVSMLICIVISLVAGLICFAACRLLKEKQD